MTGPRLSESIDEVRGSFADQAALDDALDRLTRAGFDRADLSLPRDDVVETPDRGADAPVTETDQAQMRTLGASGAAAVVALAAAGATIATGGAAAVAAVAAVAAGTGAGAAAYAGINGAGQAGSDGPFILSVRLTSATRRMAAEEALADAGARDIHVATREDH